MSRIQTAKELGIDEATLRAWEGDVLPVFGEVSEESYRDLARAVHCARAGGATLASLRKVFGAEREGAIR